MAIMNHAKFHFNRLMLTLIFGIWASELPPPAWRTTEKAGPDRVKILVYRFLSKWVFSDMNLITFTVMT